MNDIGTPLTYTYTIVSPWSKWLSMWDAYSATGVQFPACVSTDADLIGKLANLNHSLNGGLLLD